MKENIKSKGNGARYMVDQSIWNSEYILLLLLSYSSSQMPCIHLKKKIILFHFIMLNSLYIILRIETPYKTIKSKNNWNNCINWFFNMCLLWTLGGQFWFRIYWTWIKIFTYGIGQSIQFVYCKIHSRSHVEFTDSRYWLYYL